MIGDVFDFNGKSYTIKRDMSFGEYKKITQLQLDIKHATPENENELSVKFNTSMTDFLTSIIGISEQDLDALGIINSAELFGLAFLTCASIKKKSEKTLDLPSS